MQGTDAFKLYTLHTAPSKIRFMFQVDLDTIDVSNLNRQFLFRREHVGKSKAAVAAEAVKKMQPDTNITYYHDTIFAWVSPCFRWSEPVKKVKSLINRTENLQKEKKQTRRFHLQKRKETYWK